MLPAKFHKLDVRPLLVQGTDPFSAIKERIDRLPAGSGLTVIAPFLPAPLIELLRGEGFASNVERRGDGSWVVNFWRQPPVATPANRCAGSGRDPHD
ncbi:MAG: DUF2249 domain-containing protein [Opitutaceae bacterium]|nr:DUF2249 domain-containing protein [Opitutaceae bacterium]